MLYGVPNTMAIRAEHITFIDFGFQLFPASGITISSDSKVFLGRIPVVKVIDSIVLGTQTTIQTSPAAVLDRHLLDLVSSFLYRFYITGATTSITVTTNYIHGLPVLGTFLDHCFSHTNSITKYVKTK